MSIASAIATKQQQVADAYTAVSAKGGTLPATRNLTNLATAIGTITGGGGSEVGITREIGNGIFRMPTSSFVYTIPSSATNVGPRAFQYSFYGCTALTSVNLSSLTSISGMYAFNYAFYNCTALTSVNISSLATLSASNAFGYAFYNCSNLVNVDLSSLTNITGLYTFQYAFYGCSKLTSIDLSALTSITGALAFNYAFQNCSMLTDVDLSSLATISSSSVFQNAFYGCTSLRSLSFPSLTPTSFGSSTNQFNNMLRGCSNVTVHFPYNLQSVIGNWSDVTNGFGGSSTTVLFDLNAAVVDFSTDNNEDIWLSVLDDSFKNGSSYTNNLKINGTPTYDTKTGVLTDTTGSNYLQLTHSIDFSEAWEVKTKIKTTSDSSQLTAETNFIAEQTDGRGFRFHLHGGHLALLCGNSISWPWINSNDNKSTTNSFTGALAVSADTVYFIKFGWDKVNNKYYLEYSLDDVTYTRDIEYNGNSRPIETFSPYFGRSNSSSYTSSIGTTVYMADTSCKVNNIEQFGFLTTQYTFESIGAPGDRDYIVYSPIYNTLNYDTVLNLVEGETRTVNVVTPTTGSVLNIAITGGTVNESTLIAGNLSIPCDSSAGFFSIRADNSAGKTIDYSIPATSSTLAATGTITLTGSTQFETITLTPA